MAKQSVGLCVVGASATGKSTLVQKLISLTCSFTNPDVNADERALSRSVRSGTPTVDYYVHQLTTSSFNYTIFDCPGVDTFHSTQEMISAVSQSDVGLLVVSAVEEEFLKSIDKQYPVGQARNQAIILQSMGVQQIIVCVNKMDKIDGKDQSSQFENVKLRTEKMLTKIGFSTRKTAIVPISALTGDNLAEKSPNMQWWTGFEVRIRIRGQTIQGLTVADVLNNVVYHPKRSYRKDEPFRFSVCRVRKVCVDYEEAHADASSFKMYELTGRVDRGKVKLNQGVAFYPGVIKGKVTCLNVFGKNQPEAIAGDQVIINCQVEMDKSKSNDIDHVKVGLVMCASEDSEPSKDAYANTRNPLACENAAIRVLGYVPSLNGKLECGKAKKPTYSEKTSLAVNGYCRLCLEQFGMNIYFADMIRLITKYACRYRFSLHVRSANVSFSIQKFNWKMGPTTNNDKQYNPSFVESRDHTELVIKPSHPIAVTKFEDYQPLRGIVVIDADVNRVAMVCRVLDVKSIDGGN